MRGLFTAGVLDVLMERGVKFDGAIGVSAGACFGCNYKSGQVGRVIRYNKRFAKDPRYCSWTSLLRTGNLFGADFCYRELPMELDVFDAAAYAENPMEFHVVATDCATGKAVYRRLDMADETAFRWIQASASMPLVSRPVEIKRPCLFCRIKLNLCIFESVQMPFMDMKFCRMPARQWDKVSPFLYHKRTRLQPPR